MDACSGTLGVALGIIAFTAHIRGAMLFADMVTNEISTDLLKTQLGFLLGLRDVLLLHHANRFPHVLFRSSWSIWYHRTTLLLVRTCMFMDTF